MDLNEKGREILRQAVPGNSAERQNPKKPSRIRMIVEITIAAPFVLAAAFSLFWLWNRYVAQYVGAYNKSLFRVVLGIVVYVIFRLIARRTFRYEDWLASVSPSERQRIEIDEASEHDLSLKRGRSSKINWPNEAD